MKSPLNESTNDERLEGAIKQLNEDAKIIKEIKDINRILRRIVAAIALERKGVIVIDERSVNLVSWEPLITIGTDLKNRHVVIRVRD